MVNERLLHFTFIFADRENKQKLMIRNEIHILALIRNGNKTTDTDILKIKFLYHKAVVASWWVPGGSPATHGGARAHPWPPVATPLYN